MVFYWSLSDSKSLQVSRTLLSILAYLNNAVVWIVSTCPFISKFSSTCTNPWVTQLDVLITISIIVTFMFHSFFKFSKVYVLISLFEFFQFYSVAYRNSKIPYSVGSLFLLTITSRSGLLAEIRLSVCTSKSQRTLCVSFSRTDFGLCIIIDK